MKMPIYKPDIITERGKADAKRHREKQREVIKKNLPHIIAEESIITSKKNKTIKIPIKGLEIPYFRPGKKGQSIGVGEGEGKPGDIIGQRPGDKGKKPGKPGDQPGEDYIETEIELEELIELILEDIGLPKLEEKEVKKFLIELGWKIKGVSKAGPWILLDSKRTAKEGIKRFWSLLRALQNETGRDELTCFEALKKASGLVSDALKILHDPSFVSQATTLEPFPIFETEDLRFRRIKPDIKHQSKAVVIAMMDVSGSMSDTKKYLARSMLFWLTNFLRKIYEEIEIRFIIHHSEAKLVDEDSFFKTGESGGTCAYTAFELANNLIENEYPLSEWNVYLWYFSDGEDFYPQRTIEEMKKIFAQNINMTGYGEIRPEKELNYFAGDSFIMKHLKNTFVLQEIDSAPKILVDESESLLTVIIEKKEHLLPTLKAFLKKDRWIE